MAGGPIFPRSAYPATAGLVFPIMYDFPAGGTVSPFEEMLGVVDATTLDADATWHLRFDLPPAIPTGTCKLRILSVANASTGAIAHELSWKKTTTTGDPSVGTLSAENPSNISFTATDDYVETKITLDAATAPTAGDENKIIVMDWVIENTGTTVAADTGHSLSIIWE